MPNPVAKTTKPLKRRKKFRPCHGAQVIVYECKKCGFQEERKMGAGYLMERACPNSPACHDRVYAGGPTKGQPLGASDMSVAGMNCWHHGSRPAPHQPGRKQLTIYDRT